MKFFLPKKRDENLHQTIQNSFQGVKGDISKIFEWLNYLYHKTSQQEKFIHELQRQVMYVPKTSEELKELMDSHYSITPLQNKVDRLTSKIDSLEQSNRAIYSLKYQIEQIQSRIESLAKSSNSINHLIPQIDRINQKIEELNETQQFLKDRLEEYNLKPEPTNVPPIHLKEKLIRKIARSSKEHIKNIIRTLIMKYGKISALQLRDILVEEQALCSKSTFYRLLEELEEDHDISVIHEKKEKKYVYNILKIK